MSYFDKFELHQVIRDENNEIIESKLLSEHWFEFPNFPELYVTFDGDKQWSTSSADSIFGQKPDWMKVCDPKDFKS